MTYNVSSGTLNPTIPIHVQRGGAGRSSDCLHSTESVRQCLPPHQLAARCGSCASRTAAAAVVFICLRISSEVPGHIVVQPDTDEGPVRRASCPSLVCRQTRRYM